MSQNRVRLDSISSLTFYKDSQTRARRTRPIPQLKCIGKPCSLYQPEAVRCVNVGGSGTEVDWKCEADLPEALRFGRVEVSCEGWDAPGDPTILKGSCGLEYRLVEIPGGLRGNSDPSYPSRFSNWFSDDPSGAIFMVIWLAVLFFILYAFLKSCFGSRNNPSPAARPPASGPGGWFSGFQGPHRPDDTDAPPPYTKYAPGTAAPAAEGWRPGFWTGAALGGLGASLFANRDRERQRARMYDWETRAAPPFQSYASSSSWWGGRAAQGAAPRRPARFDDYDRGEGSSNLGSMRRSTGLGGSNVR